MLTNFNNQHSNTSSVLLAPFDERVFAPVMTGIEVLAEVFQTVSEKEHSISSWDTEKATRLLLNLLLNPHILASDHTEMISSALSDVISSLLHAIKSDKANHTAVLRIIQVLCEPSFSDDITYLSFSSTCRELLLEQEGVNGVRERMCGRLCVCVCVCGLYVCLFVGPVCVCACVCVCVKAQ